MHHDACFSSCLHAYVDKLGLLMKKRCLKNALYSIGFWLVHVAHVQLLYWYWQGLAIALQATIIIYKLVMSCHAAYMDAAYKLVMPCHAACMDARMQAGVIFPNCSKHEVQEGQTVRTISCSMRKGLARQADYRPSTSPHLGMCRQQARPTPPLRASPCQNRPDLITSHLDMPCHLRLASLTCDDLDYLLPPMHMGACSCRSWCATAFHRQRGSAGLAMLIPLSFCRLLVAKIFGQP